MPQPPSVLLLGAHGPAVDSETVRRDMVAAGPNCNIHTTNNEYPDPGKHSYTLRFVLVSRHRALSRWRSHFSKRPLENESPVHTVQHFSTPPFHFSKPTLENERPAHTVQHFWIPPGLCSRSIFGLSGPPRHALTRLCVPPGRLWEGGAFKVCFTASGSREHVPRSQR